MRRISWPNPLIPAALLGLALGWPARGARADIIEGFENIGNLSGQGWAFKNLSTAAQSPLGTIQGWSQGTSPNPFSAQAGAATSYIQVSVTSSTAAAAATMSNWLITPVFSFNGETEISFYTRTRAPVSFPDRLQVRLSPNGASTDVGSTTTSVGDFQTLLVDINPTYSLGGYPTTWQKYTLDLSAVAPGTGRLAFRWFVQNSGTTGSNGDLIGIDSFRVVPEPSSLALCGLALPALILRRRMSRR